MQVVITKKQLQDEKSCGAHLNSPEWSESEQALVYTDWDATVERLLSTNNGTDFLDWLVLKQLVPMTKDEFIQARNARRSR